MNKNQSNRKQFIATVKQSSNKKTCIPDRLLAIMNENKFFTNEDIDMDDSCYEKWNSYEIKLIRHFLNDNAHRFAVGELIDAELITESKYTRRKLVYSKFSKTELLNQKKAIERDNRIEGIFED